MRFIASSDSSSFTKTSLCHHLARALSFKKPPSSVRTGLLSELSFTKAVPSTSQAPFLHEWFEFFPSFIFFSFYFKYSREYVDALRQHESSDMTFRVCTVLSMVYIYTRALVSLDGFWMATFLLCGFDLFPVVDRTEAYLFKSVLFVPIGQVSF